MPTAARKIIKRAGLYDLSASDYHADPCPYPSLSSSCIQTIIEECAARAWAEHPRNPRYEADDPTKFDLPNTCHALMLNAGRDYVVIDAPDWRKDATKEERAKVIAEGKIAILPHQLEQASEIVAAGQQQLAASSVAEVWHNSDAKSEVVGVWRDIGTWGRLMADRLLLPLAEDRGGKPPIILDYKTTEAALNEWSISNYAANQGWHIQSNWYKRGIDKITNAAETWQPPVFIFVVQSRKKPYPLMIAQLDRAFDHLAVRQIEHAIERWSAGLAGKWAGWSDALAQLPSWYQSQWIERELAEGIDDPILTGGAD